MNILHRFVSLAIGLMAYSLGAAQPLVVNSADDANDGVCNAMHCSLREAIIAANQNPGPDTIAFNVPGPIPVTIAPLGPLPALTGAGTVIDATTMPGGGIGKIMLDGINAGVAANGLEIAAASCAVFGLDIRRFTNGIRISSNNTRIGIAGKGNVLIRNDNAGIWVAGTATGTIVHGNSIGVNAEALTPNPNSYGVFLEGQSSGSVSNVLIGGSQGQGNLIAGNSKDGIFARNVTGLTVFGNHIGFSPFAPGATPNGRDGIHVESSVNVVIGDAAVPNSGNRIAGNGRHGILLEVIPAGARVEANEIGLFFTGNMPLGNGGNGLFATATPGARIAGNGIHNNALYGLEVTETDALIIENNEIGFDTNNGASAGNGLDGIRLSNCSSFVIEENTVSGNGHNGISIQMSPDPAPANGSLYGNRVGRFDTAANAAGNTLFGIRVANVSNLLIGGGASQGNVVGGNGAGGVLIRDALDVILQHNAVGSNAASPLPLPNLGPGVWIDGSSEGILIGGPNAGNTIAFNQAYGVQVSQDALGVTISQNSIFCNAGGGIQTDAGANDDVPPPGQICARPGSASGTAPPFAIIEFFGHHHGDCAAPPCQGRYFIGSTLAAADGSWAFAGPFAPGDTLTATATNLLGSTSAFSHCAPVLELPSVIADNTGPACAGDTVQLIASVQPALPGYVFTWTGPGNFISTDTSPSVWQAGLYTLALTAGFCQTIRDTTEVRYLPLSSGQLQGVRCHSDSLVVNGRVYNAGRPTGTEILTGANGCDSIVSINLSFLPPATSTLSFDICPDEMITVHGIVFDAGRLSGIVVIPGAGAQGCDSTVTINLRLLPAPEYNLNRSICPDEQLIVNGTVYNAQRTSGVEIFPGAAANGCDSIVRIQLSIDTLALDIELQAANCSPQEGGRIVIQSVSGGTPPYSMAVNAGATQALGPLPRVLNGLAPGSYQLLFSDDNRCVVQQQVIIPDSVLFRLQPDTTIRLRPGQSVSLGPEWGFVPESVRWSPAEGLSCSDCPNPSTTPSADKTYQLTAMHQGCTAQQRVQLMVLSEPPVYAPNAFSPNGDGINDHFTLYADVEEAPRVLLLRIFDRWGGMVYEGRDIVPGDEATGWDGKVRGKDCSAGTYLFAAEVETAFGEVIPVQGAFQLLR